MNRKINILLFLFFIFPLSLCANFGICAEISGKSKPIDVQLVKNLQELGFDVHIDASGKVKFSSFYETEKKNGCKTSPLNDKGEYVVALDAKNRIIAQSSSFSMEGKPSCPDPSYHGIWSLCGDMYKATHLQFQNGKKVLLDYPVSTFRPSISVYKPVVKRNGILELRWSAKTHENKPIKGFEVGICAAKNKACQLFKYIDATSTPISCLDGFNTDLFRNDDDYATRENGKFYKFGERFPLRLTIKFMDGIHSATGTSPIFYIPKLQILEKNSVYAPPTTYKQTLQVGKPFVEHGKLNIPIHPENKSSSVKIAFEICPAKQPDCTNGYIKGILENGNLTLPVFKTDIYSRYEAGKLHIDRKTDSWIATVFYMDEKNPVWGRSPAFELPVWDCWGLACNEVCDSDCCNVDRLNKENQWKWWW
jgi:hypothetical protein